MENIHMDYIFLRESVFTDCDEFAKWEKTETVSEFFTMNKGRGYKEIVTEFIKRNGDKNQIQLTICSSSDEQAIGRVYIQHNPTYDSMDITRIYIGDAENRGKGYGEQALKACLILGFNVLGCERVTLDYMSGNDKARSLYLKLGFKDEGCMRHAGKKDGRYVDLNLMSILKEEYFK